MIEVFDIDVVLSMSQYGLGPSGAKMTSLQVSSRRKGEDGTLAL